MSRISVYEYKDYKRYIIDWIESSPNNGRGLRKSLADAIGCQTPFITHVLSGDYHLSAEQAEASSRWMGLNDTDTEFFILLVMKQRAGTKSLEALFSKQLSQYRENQAVLKKRVKIEETLPLDKQMIYYSSWLFAAIHMATLVPSLQTIDALLKHFQISRISLMKAIEFLIENGLIEEKNGHLKNKKSLLFLERNSPLLPLHHTNWRLRSIEAIQTKNPDHLHYSGVLSLSEEDFEWVREKLSGFLGELSVRLKDSKDERVASLCFDWFQL